jgi:hypothetical protein
MKSFKYTINGNVYKVHINSVVDDIAEVEVNGTPYNVKMEKPAKKQMVTLKRRHRLLLQPAANRLLLVRQHLQPRAPLRLRYQVLSCKSNAM